MRIQREQGKKSASHSTQVMLWTFDFHFDSAAHGDDEELEDVVSGCWRGMIRTGRAKVGMEDPAAKSV